MIKLTPQELANIFQCFVAEERDGDVFNLYAERPEIRGDYYFEWEGDIFMEIDKKYVDIPSDHVWNRCYAPESVKVKEQMVKEIKKRTEQLKRDFESCYERIFPKSFEIHYLLKGEDDL